MKRDTLLFIAFPFMMLAGCRSSHSSYHLYSFISHKADSLQKTQQLPGIFVAILDNDKRYYYGAGYADPDSKMPFDSATIFEIGSISKTFTAYALTKVLEEKNISDSSSILGFLPDSVQPNKALASIRCLDLLNHTSGLPRLPENMNLAATPMSPYDDYTAKQLFSYLKTCTPQPDGQSNYSNLGAGLAGVLAQRISGLSYENLLAQYIFSPFGIKQHPDSTITAFNNKAQGYFDKGKSPYWFADVLAPAGGLKCSAGELLSYLQNLFSPPDTTSKKVIDRLLEPTVTLSPVMKVCRAWHTLEEKDQPVIYWHNGGTYGFSTFAGFLKEKKKAVVIVINQFNRASISDEMGFTILQKLAAE